MSSIPRACSQVQYVCKFNKVNLGTQLTQSAIYCVLVTQSYLTLGNPMNCSPSSSVCGILQAKIMELVANSFSRGSSWPRDWTWISLIAGRFFTIWAIRKSPYCTLLFVILFTQIICKKQTKNKTFLTLQYNTLKGTVVQYSSWHTGGHLHLQKFATWKFICRGLLCYITELPLSKNYDYLYKNGLPWRLCL